MTYGYKAIMSTQDDALKQSIHPLLPEELKFGLILWIYVICEVWMIEFVDYT